MDENRIGFSTGALEKSDYRAAMSWMLEHEIGNIELSALRFEELQPLAQDIDDLPTDEFAYVSFHAPSSFSQEQERFVVALLEPVVKKGWNIIVHPDVVYTPSLWQHFGSQLLIENMDRRKSVGRTVPELSRVFDSLPDARLCLDVAHARQIDTTLGLLRELIATFGHRIAEIHISELDSRCKHRPLSSQAVTDYRQLSGLLRDIPVIIESVLGRKHCELRQQEVRLAREAME